MSSFSNQLRKRPAAAALISQVVAAVVTQGLYKVAASSLGLTLPFFWLLVFQGCLAALIGHLLGLPRWWFIINFVFPPLAGLALTLGLPPWIYLLFFMLLALVFWNSAGDRVPLYLTNKHTWQKLFTLIPKKKGVQFIDVGSGLGGLLSFLSRTRPDGQFTGVETAPLPYLFSKFRLLRAGNVSLRYGSIWDEDLSSYDVVYCFLSPEPMPKLFQKAKAEMRSGSMLISNSFEVPDHPADETIVLDDSRKTHLHIWYFGRPSKGRR